MAVGMIRVGKGMGDVPGVQGGSGVLQVLHNKKSIDTRTQT